MSRAAKKVGILLDSASFEFAFKTSARNRFAAVKTNLGEGLAVAFNELRIGQDASRLGLSTQKLVCSSIGSHYWKMIG